MRAFDEEMRSLRRKMRHVLEWMGWPPAAQAAASARLAQDLGLPNSEVSRILDRTAAELRKLSVVESDELDARPIIDRAVNELAKLGFHTRPFEEAAMERYLQELADADYEILRQFKLGKKHSEIAESMKLDVEQVRSSLVKTYAELRIRMSSSSDDGGGGEPARAPPATNNYGEAPLKQTSVHHN